MKQLIRQTLTVAISEPSDILNTYSERSMVVDLVGIGDDAAVMFYKARDDAERFTLFARNYKWTLDIRSDALGTEKN